MQGQALQQTASTCPCRPLSRPFTAQAPAQKHSACGLRRLLRQTRAHCQHKLHTTSVQNFGQHIQEPIHLIADAPRPDAPSAKLNSPVPLPYIAAAAGVAVTFFFLKKIFDTPSRAYKENVGDEYDSWTEDGVLEYYWGEHIHLGYYSGANFWQRSACCCSFAVLIKLK